MPIDYRRLQVYNKRVTVNETAPMEKTLKLLAKGFESSSTTTPEFATYARTFRNELKNRLKEIGAEFISFNRGHFYVSGFFKKDGQMYYFSQSDVRWFAGDSILVRTAKHEKDFSGGSNNFTTLDSQMFSVLPV